MAQKIKSIKQKLANGTFSNPIPFGIDGENIDLANGYNLQQTLGTINVNNKGTVQKQLNDLEISVGSKAEANSIYTKTEVNNLLTNRFEWTEVSAW